jgi:hypothetical protein
VQQRGRSAQNNNDEASEKPSHPCSSNLVYARFRTDGCEHFTGYKKR